MAKMQDGSRLDYTDSTDLGMDQALLSSSQQARVQAAKEGWNKAHAAGDQAGMDYWHGEAEKVRGEAGYSGGTNGGGYIPLDGGGRSGNQSGGQGGQSGGQSGQGGGSAWGGGYSASPVWSAPYQARLADALEKLERLQAFSYDVETDPAYAQYREQYTREGRRAMEDILGQVAARTGGLASSYAASAASQANDYYMKQLGDKIPQLRQLAYEMWQDEAQRLLKRVQLYDELNSTDATRWGSTVLKPFQADRELARG